MSFFQPLLRRWRPLTLIFFCGSVGTAVPGFAAEATATSQPPSFSDLVRRDLERMDEIFGTSLPGTLAQYNLVLKFSPKFGDLRDYEFVRYPLELRYGLNDKTEIYGGLTPYHPNPFNGGNAAAWGFGESKIGVRYNFGRFLWFYDESTIGIEARSPLGKPPIQIIDGYSHLRPFVTASRKLRLIPATSFYTNFSYDREVTTPERASPAGVMEMHVAEIGPGFLYKPGEFGAFAEYRFQFITTDAHTHHAHNRKVGVLWDVPLKRSQQWKLPGKWQLELAYKFNRETGFDEDRGLTARVSWRTSLREVLDITDKVTGKKVTGTK